MTAKKTIRIILFTLVICFITSAFFMFLYSNDNKYTKRTYVTQEGVTMLSDTENDAGLSETIHWLVDGWEFYPDQLIEPGETSDNSIPIYIGQYFSFSAFHEDKSPYGTGSYRLLVSGNGTYTLFLPEVFSSCEVYINGQQVSSSGSINPYKEEVKDLLIPVTLNGTTEILIRTANYTHYYSGISYPPAIGSPQAINNLISSRLLYYGFLVFTSLTLAVFASVVWIGPPRKRTCTENFWLGILALSFSLRLCYPFIHNFGLPYKKLSYTMEDAMASLGMFCIVRTVTLICLKKNSLLKQLLTGSSVAFIVISILFPVVLLQYLPAFTTLYGNIIYWYKLCTAIAMLFIILFSRKDTILNKQPFLLWGLIIYAVSLIAHARCLGHFEPSRFGWFEEWGTYALIICFFIRMVLQNFKIVRENHYLNEHLQQEVDRKTQTLSSLLEQRRKLLSGFAHDLKTPITSITTFTRLIELDNTQLDDESMKYLDIIRQKIKEIQKHLQALHKFNHMDAIPSCFSNINLLALVQDFFEKNKPDIEANGINFKLITPDSSPVIIYGDEQKLTSVLQNLVYNALSFTSDNGTIELKLLTDQNNAILIVKDDGTGISSDILPYIFDLFFTLRENNQGEGIGLFIVKSIIAEHKGTILVDSEEGKGTIFTIKLPISANLSTNL